MSTSWVGRNLWLPWIGEFLVQTDKLQPAEVILPLAGGQDRVVYAADLFKQGYAKWYLVTDMPLNLPGIRQSYGNLVKQEAIWQGVPEDRFLSTGEEVTTTYAEAWSVRRLMESHNLVSLLVVTAPYHTQRARWILEDVFEGSNISFQVVTMTHHWYRVDNWWTSESGARETWTEYLKLIMYRIGYHG